MHGLPSSLSSKSAIEVLSVNIQNKVFKYFISSFLNAAISSVFRFSNFCPYNNLHLEKALTFFSDILARQFLNKVIDNSIILCYNVIEDEGR